MVGKFVKCVEAANAVLDFVKDDQAYYIWMQYLDCELESSVARM